MMTSRLLRIAPSSVLLALAAIATTRAASVALEAAEAVSRAV